MLLRIMSTLGQVALAEAAIVGGAFLMEDFFPPAGDRKWLFVVIASVALLVVWIAIAYLVERRKEAKRRESRKLQAQIDKLFETISSAEQSLHSLVLFRIAQAVGADLSGIDTRGAESSQD